MKVLVATSQTQGQRENDFNFCVEGELVTVGLVCATDRYDPDGGCGCGRAFAGLNSHRATTTAKVKERRAVARRTTSRRCGRAWPSRAGPPRTSTNWPTGWPSWSASGRSARSSSGAATTSSSARPRRRRRGEGDSRRLGTARGVPADVLLAGQLLDGRHQLVGDGAQAGAVHGPAGKVHRLAEPDGDLRGRSLGTALPIG